jgi:hypothetical protein
MSTPHLRVPGAAAGHPSVQQARVRNALITGLAAAAALTISLAIAVAVPKPNTGLTLVLAVGGLGVVALVTNQRLEVTVTLVVLYLGLLDGPVKLLSGGHELASVVRDILIFAVSAGALLRLLAKRQRIELPPLIGWVLLWVALVVVEAFNPNTGGIVKALGGFRQQLEFIPFFFFGYALIRTKERFRRVFLILGVIALANGVVSTYQTKLSPGGLASWGPGYKELVVGTQTQGSETGISGRGYVSGGVSHIRPPGLGKDAGFAGSMGLLALPCVLALLATWRRRKRWIPVLLCLGALLGVATGLGRLQLVGALLVMVAFAVLSASAGRRAARPLVALLGVLLLAIPFGGLLIAFEAPGTFSRYTELGGSASSGKDTKSGELAHLPHQLAIAPFGVGLASAGAATGFGGRVTNRLEGHSVGGETQFNFLGDELGIPGIALWYGLLLTLLVLAAARLRRIDDIEIRIALAGVFSVLVTFLVTGVSGPVTSSAGGSYFWFAAGIGAYWLAGPGYRASLRRAREAITPPRA